MASATAIPESRRRPKHGDPTWDIAHLYPPQGEWTEDEYLDLETNRLIEFTDGYLEVLPLPVNIHQYILYFLCRQISAFAEPRELGDVLPSGVRVRLWNGVYRQPDLAFGFKKRILRNPERYWEGADLVMEVVSPGAGDHQRDYVAKRREYAKGRVPEYWIVDPQEEVIIVLALNGGSRYKLHGKFGRGQRATSVLLAGFGVSVDAVFDQGKRPARRKNS